MPVAGIVLSEDVIGANLHWFKGRSFPHLEPSSHCEACQAQRPIRWAGYVPIWVPQTNALAILELTPGVVDQVELYKQQHATLRGAALTLMRPSGKANGRLTANLKPGGIPAPNIPQPMDVRAALSRIWELPDTVTHQNVHVQPIAMAILDPELRAESLPANHSQVVRTAAPPQSEQAAPPPAAAVPTTPKTNCMPKPLASRLNGVGNMP